MAQTLLEIFNDAEQCMLLVIGLLDMELACQDIPGEGQDRDMPDPCAGCAAQECGYGDPDAKCVTWGLPVYDILYK